MVLFCDCFEFACILFDIYKKPPWRGGFLLGDECVLGCEFGSEAGFVD